jgi:hypothetical protein
MLEGGGWVQRGAYPAGQAATHTGARVQPIFKLYYNLDVPVVMLIDNGAPKGRWQVAQLLCFLWPNHWLQPRWQPAQVSPTHCACRQDELKTLDTHECGCILHAGKILYPECKKGVWPPSDWQPALAERSARLPSARLHLEFVYGYDGCVID